MSKGEEKSLEEEVWGWLQKHGYSLEMRIAQVLKRVGFEISQFGHYIDPESGDSREIDVIASKVCQTRGMHVVISLYVECKYARKKPWVIFASSRRFGPLFYFSRVLGEKPNLREWAKQESFQGRLLSRILFSVRQESLQTLDFFAMPERAGYGITEVLRAKNAKDNAYTALMQISKCVEAHDIEVERIFDRTIKEYESGWGLGDPQLSGSIAFPVVVVDGKLYECFLGQKNETVVSETKSSILLWSSSKRGGTADTRISVSPIRILTENRLPSFAKEAYQAITFLLSQKVAIRELWEDELQRLGWGREDDSFLSL